MSSNLGLTQNQWTAVAAAAAAAAYLVYTLVGMGFDLQLTRQAQMAEQVSVRHDRVCAQLGKRPGSVDHATCMEALSDLKGWHHKLFLDETESLL